MKTCLCQKMSLFPRIQNENFCKSTPNKPKLINEKQKEKTRIYQKTVC
jgi:hypothetical protein